MLQLHIKLGQHMSIYADMLGRRVRKTGLEDLLGVVARLAWRLAWETCLRELPGVGSTGPCWPVVSHRLIPMKAGPPKHSAEEDAGNPNHGSSTSHRTARNSSGSMPHVIMFVLAAAPVSISIKHT